MPEGRNYNDGRHIGRNFAPGSARKIGPDDYEIPSMRVPFRSLARGGFGSPGPALPRMSFGARVNAALASVRGFIRDFTR